jgi:hypothetical protein
VNVTLRRSIAAAVVLAVPLLSSCGFDQPTDRVYNPGVGVNDRSGSVDVLGAVVVSSSNGTGTVSATFVNNDPTHADAVTRVTGPGVTVSLPGPIDLKPGGTAKLSDTTPALAKGTAVKSGFLVPLTFSFERGQNVTLQVPVVPRSGDYANIPTSAPSSSSSQSPSNTASPSSSTSPSPSPSKSKG